jgi:aspartyl-tRNA(Asn)/glutamyl-tRNA(Gln) amidotransferase subunit C
MLDIERLALLARIRLTPTEKEKLQKEFGDILDYIAQLKNADIRGAEEEIGGTNLKNIVREDNNANEPGQFSEKLLKEASSTERNYIKVKHIFP